MLTQISDLSVHVEASLLDFAWRQWAQMGVSVSGRATDRWAMDPEALLLFTLEVARVDPRLFDEVLDWLRLNGRLLSLQRLQNLAKADSIDERLANAALAWAAKQNPRLPWARSKRELPSEPEVDDLFRIGTGGSLVLEPDPTFLALGLRRPLAKPTHKSRSPDLTVPVNFAFRLRQLVGTGSRAEVLRILLTTQERGLRVQEIASGAAYARRNVHEALVALAAAGVASARGQGTDRTYHSPRDRWATLLDVPIESLPRYIDWPTLLPLALRLRSWLTSEVPSDRTDYIVSSRMRELVDNLKPALLDLQIVVPKDQQGSAKYWPTFESVVESVLRMLSGRS